VIHALLAAAAANSALQEPDDIPLRSHGGSDAAQRRAEYVTLHGQFMVLAAMARQHFPTVIKRMVDDAAPPPPTESSDETKLKDSGAIAAKMTKKAEQAYNIRFVGGRKASDKQLVKTALALERGKLDVSRLDGGEYGKVSFVEKQAQPLSLSTGGRIVELPEGETLTRLAKGLATIGAVVDSFVIGGLTEIDSAKQTLAGSHGKLTDGKQYQFDMTTGRMLLGCYVALADHMTCKDLLTHFQETLLPHLGSQMAAGHSLSSAAMDAINNSAWMRPESYAKVVPTQVATSSGPSAQEFEKMQKRLKHFENENAAMKAAKDKRAAQSPSGRGASRGYRQATRRTLEVLLEQSPVERAQWVPASVTKKN